MNRAETRVEVIVDLFSGRPNPQWILSQEQIQKLQDRLAKLPSAKPKKPPKLGYRGILITNISNVPEIPERILVFNGVMSMTQEGRELHREDVHNIEEWILDLARDQGYGEAIDTFRQFSNQ